MKKIRIRINKFWNTLWVIFSIFAVVAVGVRLVFAANFHKECTSHFTNALHATTAEIAFQELSVAIYTMEDYGYTDGPILGIFEENAVGFCYSNLLNFKEELENFDSTNKYTEVYNLELNALQERLGCNEPPYLISLGSIYYRWAYISVMLGWFIVSIAYWLIESNHYDSETFSVWVPHFSLKKKAELN